MEEGGHATVGIPSIWLADEYYRSCSCWQISAKGLCARNCNILYGIVLFLICRGEVRPAPCTATLCSSQVKSSRSLRTTYTRTASVTTLPVMFSPRVVVYDVILLLGLRLERNLSRWPPTQLSEARAGSVHDTEPGLSTVKVTVMAGRIALLKWRRGSCQFYALFFWAGR